MLSIDRRHLAECERAVADDQEAGYGGHWFLPVRFQRLMALCDALFAIEVNRWCPPHLDRRSAHEIAGM